MTTLRKKILLNKILSCSASLITGSIVMSSTVVAAHADNMYIFKDKSGQVLLTNVPPNEVGSNYTQKVKVTYYPTTNTQTGSASYSTSANTPNYGVPRSGTNSTYDHLIIASATRHGVDPALIKSMMHTESAFNPNARSPVGAQGLMQLMPATARRFSVSNPWNPAENIEGAAKYIAWLSRRFNGNIEHVLAGYNAGEGNVDKYGGIPPFRETRNYVRRVLSRYNTLYRNDTGLVASTNNYSSNTGYSSYTNSSATIKSSASINNVSYSTTNNSTPPTTYLAYR